MAGDIMSQSPEAETRNRLGSLFEEITGRSTVTETQHRDGRRRVAPADESYIDGISDADGLDDAVERPDEQSNGY